MPEDWSSILEKDLQKLSEVAGVQQAKTEQLIPGERRDVAILFLDLKGFTAMSETMDHEMVHKIIGGVMNALSSNVKGHGGYVDKIEGDQIPFQASGHRHSWHQPGARECFNQRRVVVQVHVAVAIYVTRSRNLKLSGLTITRNTGFRSVAEQPVVARRTVRNMIGLACAGAVTCVWIITQARLPVATLHAGRARRPGRGAQQRTTLLALVHWIDRAGDVATSVDETVTGFHVMVATA